MPLLLALWSCATPLPAVCDDDAPVDPLPCADVEVCAVQDDESDRRTPNCYDTVDWDPACGDGIPPNLRTDGEIAAFAVGYFDEAPHGGSVISDAAAWDTLRSANAALTLPEVDFATHVVAIGLATVGSTCEAEPLRRGWVDAPAGARLYVEIAFRDGACDDRCDMVGGGVVFFALPRAEVEPQVCVRALQTCDA